MPHPVTARLNNMGRRRIKKLMRDTRTQIFRVRQRGRWYWGVKRRFILPVPPPHNCDSLTFAICHRADLVKYPISLLPIVTHRPTTQPQFKGAPR